ncbi:MAG: hypothetical protein BWY56_02043 [Acidobacteria bacterium ADurb.Bin340]|nr:MAG: hypothetical protein BWY56_02043 [Acidobacteria bacterium ADurb.Bin340]
MPEVHLHRFHGEQVPGHRITGKGIHHQQVEAPGTLFAEFPLQFGAGIPQHHLHPGRALLEDGEHRSRPRACNPDHLGADLIVGVVVRGAAPAAEAAHPHAHHAHLQERTRFHEHANGPPPAGIGPKVGGGAQRFLQIHGAVDDAAVVHHPVAGVLDYPNDSEVVAHEQPWPADNPENVPDAHHQGRHGQEGPQGLKAALVAADPQEAQEARQGQGHAHLVGPGVEHRGHQAHHQPPDHAPQGHVEVVAGEVGGIGPQGVQVAVDAQAAEEDHAVEGGDHGPGGKALCKAPPQNQAGGGQQQGPAGPEPAFQGPAAVENQDEGGQVEGQGDHPEQGQGRQFQGDRLGAGHQQHHAAAGGQEPQGDAPPAHRGGGGGRLLFFSRSRGIGGGALPPDQNQHNGKSQEGEAEPLEQGGGAKEGLRREGKEEQARHGADVRSGVQPVGGTAGVGPGEPGLDEGGRAAQGQQGQPGALQQEPQDGQGPQIRARRGQQGQAAPQGPGQEQLQGREGQQTAVNQRLQAGLHMPHQQVGIAVAHQQHGLEVQQADHPHVHAAPETGSHGLAEQGLDEKEQQGSETGGQGVDHSGLPEDVTSLALARPVPGTRQERAGADPREARHGALPLHEKNPGAEAASLYHS